MNVLNNKISKLIVKSIKGSLQGSEVKILNEWLRDSQNKELFDRITNKQNIIEKSLRYNSYNIEEAWSKLNIEVHNTRSVYGKWISIAAAVIIPLVAISIILFNQLDRNIKLPIAQERIIEPGETNAYIYLSDGKTFDLKKDTASIIQQGNLIIKRLDDRIAIKSVPIKGTEQLITKPVSAQLKKIQTGRGHEMDVELPDGTFVKLNADSHIEFYSTFEDKKRRVKTSGEVFFDVAKDKSRPFIVESGQMKVEVLGTQFNVRYYPEERELITTLIEGSVEVANFMKEKVILVPGQAARIHNQTDALLVEEVDLSTAIAWKSGIFYFKNQSMEYILKELSRWYDFEYEFEDNDLRYERFTLEVPRFSNCNKILSKIEGTQVLDIVITEDKVIVKNK